MADPSELGDLRLSTWTPDTWRARPNAQHVAYDDPVALERVVEKLRHLPPLVTSWEVEELKSMIAEAQEGRRFVLQGGDCAETFQDCESAVLTNKLKILIQMSLVLVGGVRRPVVRIGRFAGQYAKPRSKPTETRGGVELPSYFGDLVNRPTFTAADRKPDPELLLTGYFHAAMTLNFVRSMSAGSFSDLRRADYFDLGFFERAELPTRLREDYVRMARELDAVDDVAANEMMKVNFFTSHEALHLVYESAQTRTVPRRSSYYDLTTHLPWIGERTRAVDGAHVEFFRGVANPVGVKLGPDTSETDVVELCDALNPRNEPGKLVFITRMGARQVASLLPRLVTSISKSRRRVLWVSDPMHGNAIVTRSGVKTRNFDDILQELHATMDVHRECGTVFGGVHFELTGEDVTECIGGGLTEDCLSQNYMTACDPRLNYRQAIEMAFLLAGRLSEHPRP